MWAPVGSSCRCSSTVTARSTWTSWARTRSGFFIEDAALGLVLAIGADLAAEPGQQPHRTKSFTALKATAASAGLVGFEDAGFVFTVRDIVVEVNTGSSVSPVCRARWRRRSIGPVSFPVDPNGPGDRVGYEVETGDPDNPVLIDFRGTPLVGIAAAHVVLEIGDNVFVSGAFSFRMGEVETVTVEQGGLLPDITGLNVRTIKIGAEGVSVFLGDGLADYDIDADIADYLSTDTPALVLPGETVGNLVDGKVYRLVGRGADRVAGSDAGRRARIIRTRRSGGRWRPTFGRRDGGGRGRADGRRSSTRRRDLPGVRAAGQPVGERRVVEPGGRLRWAPVGSSCRCSSTVTARSTWTSWARTRSGFFIEDAALGLVLANRADLAAKPGQQPAQDEVVYGVEGDGGVGGAGRVRGRGFCVHGA